jgi:hypothetical protein
MRKNIPLFAGVVFLLALVLILEFLTLRKTNGVFCYPLDDTFIHMAVAKNVALHGNWGINAHEWVSTSSSPFFTALLALFYKIFGVNEYLPAILSIAGAVLLIAAMQQELNRYTTLSIKNKTLTVILTLFLGAIPSLAALGMEHTFQIAFTLFFVHAAASLFGNEKANASVWAAAGWGALMVITRYENAFIVAAACGLLFIRKKYAAAAIIGFISALPILLFGLYAVSQGGLFVPNSIQIKVRQNYAQLLNGGTAILELASSISGLIVMSAIVIIHKLRKQYADRSLWILSIFILAALMHTVFGGFGWFYRYEAYLIVLGVFHLLIIGFTRMQQTSWRNREFLIYAAVAVLFTFNLPLRGLNALRNYMRSTYNIYEQQYQMGLFMKRYYAGQTVAANDIGAISYMADLNTVDLWGLGDNEVTIARKGGYWNAKFLQQLVEKKQAGIAVIYDSWFWEELRNNWVKIGTWEVSYSFMLGDTKVTFYAIDPNQAAALKKNLAEFSNTLPKDIAVEIFP